MQPHKVPQNIDIEDKVVGPLTLKQFTYLMIGGGILLVINFALPESLKFIFFPTALIIGAFFAALAFYRPGDRPFSVFLASILGTLTRPKKRVWKKETFKHKKKEVVKKEVKPRTKDYSDMDLERLAFIVDSGGSADELRNRGISVGIKEKKMLEASGDMIDTIEATEKPQKNLAELLNKATEKIKKTKKEPSIQEMASLKPNKEYKYTTLKESTKGLSEYDEVLEKAKETQNSRYKDAQINK